MSVESAESERRFPAQVPDCCLGGGCRHRCRPGNHLSRFRRRWSHALEAGRQRPGQFGIVRISRPAQRRSTDLQDQNGHRCAHRTDADRTQRARQCRHCGHDRAVRRPDHRGHRLLGDEHERLVERDRCAGHSRRWCGRAGELGRQLRRLRHRRIHRRPLPGWHLRLDFVWQRRGAYGSGSENGVYGIRRHLRRLRGRHHQRCLRRRPDRRAG